MSLVGALDSEAVVEALDKNWIWLQNLSDHTSTSNGETETVGCLALFKFTLRLETVSKISAILHCTADTRYKLRINGARVTVGPTRSCPRLWYYDTIDIARHLRTGVNVIEFEVFRLYPDGETGLPFARTRYPGLSVCGSVCDAAENELWDMSTLSDHWEGFVDRGVVYRPRSADDFFMNIFETVNLPRDLASVPIKAYNFNLYTGETTPWNLHARLIPFPEEQTCGFSRVIVRESHLGETNWLDLVRGETDIQLAAGSRHSVEIQAEYHTTAFLRWIFATKSGAKLKITYSEAYESEPKAYPWLRVKGDRTDSTLGPLLGPHDLIIIDQNQSQGAKSLVYEPFWYRTFRFMRWDIEVGESDLTIQSFESRQVNYPLAPIASWLDADTSENNEMWDVSVRTLRNCMFDGYSDCPFYEQLQYAEDTRSSGLFHYLLSGDDCLMRQVIIGFAASMRPDGLVESRYPSHKPQIIPGFALFWVLQICDHHLFFDDPAFTRRMLPLVDQTLAFFDRHIDERGLVSGLPKRFWQFVDWAKEWAGTTDYPNGGVPVQGRRSNTFTYTSMLLAYVLDQVATMARHLDKPYLAEDYTTRADALRLAVAKHCFDGSFYCDSTTDQPAKAYSQHTQVFAVLSKTCPPDGASRLLRSAFGLAETFSPRFAKCSYVLMFYAFRAFAQTGRENYNEFWPTAWRPWKEMLRKNLTTWEEDPVTQRSDCHAWGSVPIYEFSVEVAGLHVTSPGWRAMVFAPRVELSRSIRAKVAIGSGNSADVRWETGEDGEIAISLRLDKRIKVISRLPFGVEVDHGEIDHLELVTTL